MTPLPFYLYPRHRKKGKPVWYCRFKDPDGIVLAGVSTGQLSKTAATTWAVEQIRTGKAAVRGRNPLFEVFADGWWTWDRCHYIRARIALGKQLSRAYVDTQRGYMVNHILPFFTGRRIKSINLRMLEEFLIALREKKGRTGTPLSGTTVNRTLEVLRIMLAETVKEELLSSNPLSRLGRVRENPRTRSILELEEIKKLFNPETMVQVWGDRLHYTMNLVACSSGLRSGEILALRIHNFHENHLHVEQSWNETYRELTPPKWGASRVVSLPRRASEAIHDLLKEDPSMPASPDRFIFSYDGVRPVNQSLVLRRFVAALKAIGIDEKTRRERNIVFHSLRHTFVSLMRGRISDSKLMIASGHKVLRTLNGYSHVSIEDLRDIEKAQDQMFGI